nr:POTRA domain-containing protein [uncultured Treponema sp.]
MGKKYLPLILAFGVFSSAGVFAAPISAIHFEGLKRTREFVLQRDVKNFIQKECDEETIHELETVLQKEGLFSEIEIIQNESEGQVEITAKVKEKITFIPVPIFSISEGKPMGGAFLIDSNAFGLMHTIAVGGFFSNHEYRGIFMYGKPPKGHVPGVTVFGSAGKKNQKYVNTDEVECIDYDMVSANTGIAITEKFTDCFSAAMSSNFGFKNFDAEKKGHVKSNRYIDLEPSITLSTSDWNGVFMSTKSLWYKHESVIYTNRYIWHMFSPGLIVQQPVFSDDFRVTFNVNGVHSKFIPYSAYVGNSQLGVNILPTKFGTRSGVGLSAGFEYATFKTKVGLFSLYGVYQCVKVEDFDTEYKFNQGVGFGTTLYLKQIAIPAMNFGIYYNATKSTVYSRFSIGMSL